MAFLSFKSKKKKDDGSQSKSNVAVTVVLAVVVGLVVALGGYVGLQYLDDKQESDKNPANVAVSDADRSKALSVAELYMGKVGNFGVVSGTVDQPTTEKRCPSPPYLASTEQSSGMRHSAE